MSEPSREAMAQACDFAAANYAAPSTSINIALEAAAAELRKGGWQPIETADRESADDIILLGPKSVDFGTWESEQTEWRESGVIVDPGLPEGWYGYKGMCPWDEQPTHWMPLPKATR